MSTRYTHCCEWLSEHIHASCCLHFVFYQIVVILTNFQDSLRCTRYNCWLCIGNMYCICVCYVEFWTKCLVSRVFSVPWYLRKRLIEIIYSSEMYHLLVVSLHDMTFYILSEHAALSENCSQKCFVVSDVLSDNWIYTSKFLSDSIWQKLDGNLMELNTAYDIRVLHPVESKQLPG